MEDIKKLDYYLKVVFKPGVIKEVFRANSFLRAFKPNFIEYFLIPENILELENVEQYIKENGLELNFTTSLAEDILKEKLENIVYIEKYEMKSLTSTEYGEKKERKTDEKLEDNRQAIISRIKEESDSELSETSGESLADELFGRFMSEGKKESDSQKDALNEEFEQVFEKTEDDLQSEYEKTVEMYESRMAEIDSLQDTYVDEELLAKKEELASIFQAKEKTVDKSEKIEKSEAAKSEKEKVKTENKESDKEPEDAVYKEKEQEIEIAGQTEKTEEIEKTIYKEPEEAVYKEKAYKPEEETHETAVEKVKDGKANREEIEKTIYKETEQTEEETHDITVEKAKDEEANREEIEEIKQVKQTEEIEKTIYKKPEEAIYKEKEQTEEETHGTTAEKAIDGKANTEEIEKTVYKEPEEAVYKEKEQTEEETHETAIEKANDVETKIKITGRAGQIEEIGTEETAKESSIVDDDLKNADSKSSFKNDREKLIDISKEIVKLSSEISKNKEISEIDNDSLAESLEKLHLLASKIDSLIKLIEHFDFKTKLAKIVYWSMKYADALNKNVDINYNVLGTIDVRDNIIDLLSHPIEAITKYLIRESPSDINYGKFFDNAEKLNIFIEAMQIDDDLIVEISDDGKGLNRKDITKSAIENRLLTKFADDYSDNEMFSLLLDMDFDLNMKTYSSKKISEEIEKIRALEGDIIIESTIDKGTKFSIQISNLSMLMDAYPIIIAGERYCILKDNVIGIFKADKESIFTENEQTMIKHKDFDYPLVEIDKISAKSANYEEYRVVLLSSTKGKFAILLDEIFESELIAFRDILDDDMLKDKVLGYTILKDKDISFVLDVDAIY